MLFETSWRTHDDFILHFSEPWHPSLQFDSKLKRLVEGEPIAYIVGSSMFYQSRFIVNPSVLIPRPETEELIELVLKKTLGAKSKLRVVDIGTGSGAIGCTLKRLNPLWQVGASDIDPKALEVAKENASKMNLSIDFRLGSALEPWVNEPLDGIISNPPYILDRQTIDSSVLDYEPHHALLCQQDTALFGPLMQRFQVDASLQFIGFELLDVWQPWLINFVHENKLDVSVTFLKDINQKVRFAWIERKRLK